MTGEPDSLESSRGRKAPPPPCLYARRAPRDRWRSTHGSAWPTRQRSFGDPLLFAAECRLLPPSAACPHRAGSAPRQLRLQLARPAGASRSRSGRARCHPDRRGSDSRAPAHHRLPLTQPRLDPSQLPLFPPQRALQSSELALPRTECALPLSSSSCGANSSASSFSVAGSYHVAIGVAPEPEHVAVMLIDRPLGFAPVALRPAGVPRPAVVARERPGVDLGRLVSVVVVARLRVVVTARRLAARPGSDGLAGDELDQGVAELVVLLPGRRRRSGAWQQGNHQQ